MGFGTEIKRLRNNAKISAKKLADLIGIDSERLRKWELNDQGPRHEDKLIIEKYFGNSLEAIMKWEEIPNEFLVSKPFHKTLLTKKLNPKKGTIIFTDADFSAGNSIEFYDDAAMINASYTMDIPEFAGTTSFRSYGDSMEPIIKSGSIVFATKIEDWASHLEYGQIYGIVCQDNRRYLKYIRKSKKENSHFLLKSENEFYDDFEIPKEKIKNVWLIHGWLNKRT